MSNKFVLTAEEIKGALVVPEGAVDAYRFALANAGIEMDDETEADFVTRRNAKSGWQDLKEVSAWFKKAHESIETMLKHSFNLGSDEQLPNYAKWSKQSYTYEFNGDVGVTIIRSLAKRSLVNVDQLLALVKPEQLAKVSGMTVDKLADMFPDTILAKPKARTLTIK